MDDQTENDPLSEVLLRKVKIPKRLCDFVDDLAVVIDAPPKWCLGMLMMKVDHLVSTRPELFGFEFERARDRQQKRSSYEIDLSRLHRSDKTKSGFVGVYANGKGFTAYGKPDFTSNEQKSLGTFATAAQAAEARRLHHLKLGLPYGALAERIETFRHSNAWENASDELKRRQAIYELAQEGTPAEGLSDEDRVWETTDPLSPKSALTSG